MHIGPLGQLPLQQVEEVQTEPSQPEQTPPPSPAPNLEGLVKDITSGLGASLSGEQQQKIVSALKDDPVVKMLIG